MMKSALFFIPSPHTPLSFWISHLQLQLLHGGPRIWEGAPHSCRVRVAQDVAPKPPPAVQRRSPCQRESRRFVPQPQQQQHQQLHQHQERNTVRPNHSNLRFVSPSTKVFPGLEPNILTAVTEHWLFSVIRFLFFLGHFPGPCCCAC